MTEILTPGERTSAWGTVGDLAKRVGRLEAVDPCSCFALTPTTYDDIVATIPVDFAYYKLPETGTDDWADYSGGGRTLTHTARTNEVRGYAGIVEEDDGVLGVYVDGSPPSSGHSATYVGSRTGDAFFRFAGTAAFTVIAWVNPDFFGPGGVFSFGICGNTAQGVTNTPGWGLYVEPTTNRAFFQRRSSSGSQTKSITVALLPQSSWSMVAGTYDSTTMKVWLDGAVEDSDASSVSLSGTDGDDFFLGAVGIAEGIGGTWAPWKGGVDSVLVAAGDLSDLIPDLFAAGPAGIGVPDGYVWTNVGGVAMWAPPTIEVDF